MKQLTTDQCVTFHDSEVWKQWDHDRIAKFQMSQKKLCIPFGVFHEAIEKTLGRPVFTHEFGLNWQGIYDELFNGAEPPSIEDVIALLPKEKTVIVDTRTNHER